VTLLVFARSDAPTTAHRYVMDIALCGKTRAAGEPASVDEKPARDSTGRCDPVE